MTRAVLEGVAFNLLTCIQAFRESGATVDRIDAIGGGAASDVWLQILADVWGVPVRRRSIVEEANSLGAAVTAAVGLGLVDDFGAARGLSEVTAEFTPDDSRHTDYLGRHRVFLDGYAAPRAWNSGRTVVLMAVVLATSRSFSSGSRDLIAELAAAGHTVTVAGSSHDLDELRPAARGCRRLDRRHRPGHRRTPRRRSAPQGRRPVRRRLRSRRPRPPPVSAASS